MPELPEVEGFRTFLERALSSRRILSAECSDTFLLQDVSPARFARRAADRALGPVVRRGKIVLVHLRARQGELDPPTLALHFGMTGIPVLVAPPVPGRAPSDGAQPWHERHRWDRLVLYLDDGYQVRYRNMRRLGFVRLLPRSRVPDLLWGIGPDALEVTSAYLFETIGRRRAPIKSVLLDQSVLAGLGNIWADEVLHRARISPLRRGADLLRPDVTRVRRAIHAALPPAIEANTRRLMAPLELRLNRREGGRCRRCSGTVTAARVGGRTSYWCPSCQS